MEFQDILFEKKDGVATITLNRPEALNALSFNAYRELILAFGEIEGDREVAVVVIKSTGKFFCAGADLKDLATVPGSGMTPGGGLGGAVADPCTVIENCSRPVIAAVQGAALAGGVELLLVCDIVIMSEEARLSDFHARHGLIPGQGATQRLPRLIGIRKAKEMLFTGDWVSAQEAERIGLVNRVVPAEKLDEAVEEMCRKLVDKSVSTQATVKRLVHRGMQADIETGLELERRAMYAHFFSPAFQEGVKAFMERRKPDFQGK